MEELSRVLAANSAYEAEQKSPGVAYGLWCLSLIGLCGIQRFYTGNFIMGILMLFTLGGFGLWAIIDLFLIGSRVRTLNLEKRREVFLRYGLPG